MVMPKNLLEIFFKFGFLVLLLSNIPDVYDSYFNQIKHGSLNGIKIFRILVLFALQITLIFQAAVDWKKRFNNPGLSIIISRLLLLALPLFILLLPNFYLFTRQFFGLILVMMAGSISLRFRSYRFFKWLFFLHFLLQIIQLLFLSNYQGLLFGTFNLRNTGIFLMPSTSAIFSILMLLLFDGINSLKPTDWILFGLSVVLSASGLGLILFLVYVTWKLRLDKIVLSLILLGILPVFYYTLPIILSRPSLYLSIMDRLENWNDKISHIGLFPSDSSGKYTNAFATLAKINGDLNWKSFIIDGDVMSIFLNLGFILGLVFYWRLMRKAIIGKNGVVYFILLLASLTVSILEMLWVPLVVILIISIRNEREMAYR
jgi:hypothetical protein